MQCVYVIIDYDTNFYYGSHLIGVHKTRESARKEVEDYLGGDRYINIKEHYEYGMADEYVYTVTEKDDVRRCLLLIKAMEVEEWG